MYEVTIIWVYTNEGRKVGEFAVTGTNENTSWNVFRKAFAEWCQENGLIAKLHNFCVGTIQALDVAVTG